MAFTMSKARIGTIMTDALVPRQDDGSLTDGDTTRDGRVIPWWYTRTGVIVKYSLFFGIIFLFGLYVLIGRMHAKRRIRKGLPPLGYHRWLISRSVLARSDPRYAYPQAASYNNYNPGYYGMQAMPPPIYDPNRPPMYEGAPPMGATKVDPAQQFEAPLGPPPAAAVRQDRTGNSNPFTDPSR